MREPAADEPRDKRLTETARRCAITSLTAAQAARRIRRIMRGHWGIEDRLHRLPA